MEDVVHIAEMLVQMNVLVARLHVDLDVLTDARVAVRVVVKQIALTIVLLTVLQLVEEHVLELMVLKVDQHKTLLQTTQEVKYPRNKPFILLGNNSLKEI